MLLPPPCPTQIDASQGFRVYGDDGEVQVVGATEASSKIREAFVAPAG